jgi:hypothetical protein
MVGNRGGSRQKVAKKLLNSTDEIGKFYNLSARNAEKEPRKGEIPWLSVTFP